MRPIYENQSNRNDEISAQSRIEKWANCKLTKLQMRENIDWRAYRNDKQVALIEFKKRNNTRSKYPTYMVSHAKWLNGLRMSKTEGVPFILVIQWTDGLYYLSCKDTTPHTLGSGGRWDRNDRHDVEKMIYLDTNLFSHIPA